jgi:NTE family protein
MVTTGYGGAAPNDRIALVLGGGGARGAYQAGVLRGLARPNPDLRLPVLTGISAGAVNTVFLAAHPGTLPSASEALVRLWLDPRPSRSSTCSLRTC